MKNEFYSIDDVIKYVDYLKNLDINKSNIKILEDFKKISPEKIAKKLNIDTINFVKEFNQYKKDIHNKIIVNSKSKSLSKKTPDKFNFNYKKQIYESKICICINHFKFKYFSSTIQFYPNVKYSYVVIKDSEDIIIFNNKMKIYLTIDEFNLNFLDIREYIINKILK